MNSLRNCNTNIFKSDHLEHVLAHELDLFGIQLVTERVRAPVRHDVNEVGEVVALQLEKVVACK